MRVSLAKGWSERGILEAKGCYVRPLGKRPRKWPSQGPPAAVGERYLTAGLGWPLGRTWPTAKAFVFLRVDSMQRSEIGLSPGAPLAHPTKGMGREGVWCGRWALRPTEGKAKGREREGQREG